MAKGYGALGADADLQNLAHNFWLKIVGITVTAPDGFEPMTDYLD